jgi:hypothetical protein
MKLVFSVTKCICFLKLEHWMEYAIPLLKGYGCLSSALELDKLNLCCHLQVKCIFYTYNVQTLFFE